MPLILKQLAGALCFLVDSRSLWVLSRISHTRTKTHTHTWAENRRPSVQQHTWGNWHSRSLWRLWSSGYSSISIHALFQPQPVLFSHYLNCYQLQQETRHTARKQQGTQPVHIYHHYSRNAFYSRHTGLQSNHEYYIFWGLKSPGRFISPSLPHYSLAISGGGNSCQSQTGSVLCPVPAVNTWISHHSWLQKDRCVTGLFVSM